MATGLFASLPKPKYTGEHEEVPQHARPTGPRVVGPGTVDESQIVVRRTGPPPYGQRTGWRPRTQEDFGDGGAFPEVPVAQYPLDMGKKGQATKSNALAVQVDAEGRVKYDAIARQGHNDDRVIHSSFKDLIPLRQRSDAGEISLDRPDAETVAASTERTKLALEKLVAGAVAAQKPKNIKGTTSRSDATYVRYTPANQMGDKSKKNDRIFKIVQKQQDPMEPPKFKHKKIPRGPPSPPPPVMHSPPRKLTAEDQEAWKIPPPVSNWKNPKGYTVPLDKRLAADGRALQDVTINDKFAQFAEALFTADRHAREEVRLRAQMQQKLAEKEKLAKEEHLREMARKAREERQAALARDMDTSKPQQRRQQQRRRHSRSSHSDGRSSSAYSSGRSRSRTPTYDDDDDDDDNDVNNDAAYKEREAARRERREANERKLRQSRMGAEKRTQVLAREQNRDISEKVALGLAKPSQNAETMYDSRLFNQTSGFNSGFNEDQPYDKPLFAAQEAANRIYRPTVNQDDDDDDGGDGGDTAMKHIQRQNRFDTLGKAKLGFKGATADDDGAGGGAGAGAGSSSFEREAGPVVFEKDKDDPFGIDAMIGEVKAQVESGGGGGNNKKKRYGLEEPSQSESRRQKRARREEGGGGDGDGSGDDHGH